MIWLKRAVYPLFGAVVIWAYVFTVRGGNEPFAVTQQEKTIPQGARTHRGSYRRGHTMIWLSGYGGK